MNHSNRSCSFGENGVRKITVCCSPGKRKQSSGKKNCTGCSGRAAGPWMGLPACYCAALLCAGLGRAGTKRPAALLPGKKRKTIDPCSTSCTPSSLARESARASRALAGAAARRAEALGDSGDGAAAAYRGRGGGSGDGDVANVLASSRARTEGTGRGCRLSCAASARRARGRGGGSWRQAAPGEAKMAVGGPLARRTPVRLAWPVAMAGARVADGGGYGVGRGQR